MQYAHHPGDVLPLYTASSDTTLTTTVHGCISSQLQAGLGSNNAGDKTKLLFQRPQGANPLFQSRGSQEGSLCLMPQPALAVSTTTAALCPAPLSLVQLLVHEGTPPHEAAVYSHLWHLEEGKPVNLLLHKLLQQVDARASHSNTSGASVPSFTAS